MTMHVVFVGCALPKLSRLMEHVSAECGVRVSHIVTTGGDVDVLRREGVPDSDIHRIEAPQVLPRPTAHDLEELAALERDGVPTINNMILSDPVVSKLPYDDGVAYALYVARGLKALYQRLQPDVVLGGHDRVHSSMGFAVAHAAAIPWFGMSFSTVPMGHVALTPGIVPGETMDLRGGPTPGLDTRAEAYLQEFETGRLRAPAYVSAHSAGMVVSRLGQHARAGLRSLMALGRGSFNRYNDHALGWQVKRYVRKRRNLMRLPRKWMLTAPPAEPFVFFGLHMQPEATPDVYAPFFSNQLDVVEKIARALPPTHLFLVKLHISDADNYSPAQLRRFLQLPRVRLVLPSVSSRDFISQCAGVVTICGTMGLEAALLGKPAVLFGKMPYDVFPNVARVTDLYELPALLRAQLSAPAPSRDQIRGAYAKYLGNFFCAMTPGSSIQLDDWTHVHPSDDEKRGFVELFRALQGYLSRRSGAADAADGSPRG